jgi:hypothetical protein
VALLFSAPSLASQTTPHFGGVYRLMSNDYGISHDIDNPGKDHDIPSRVGQYLHPGTPANDYDTVWNSFNNHNGHFTVLIDGPDLNQFNQQKEGLAQAIRLTNDPIQKEVLQDKRRDLLDTLFLKAKPLDVTAIQHNRAAFSIDPPADGTHSAAPMVPPMVELNPSAFHAPLALPEGPPLMTSPVPASKTLASQPPVPPTDLRAPEPVGATNPMAALAPPVGLDTNAVTVSTTVPVPLTLPGPAAMAYQLHPPGPLNAAALGPASVSNSAP